MRPKGLRKTMCFLFRCVSSQPWPYANSSSCSRIGRLMQWDCSNADDVNRRFVGSTETCLKPQTTRLFVPRTTQLLTTLTRTKISPSPVYARKLRREDFKPPRDRTDKPCNRVATCNIGLVTVRCEAIFYGLRAGMTLVLHKIH